MEQHHLTPPPHIRRPPETGPSWYRRSGDRGGRKRESPDFPVAPPARNLLAKIEEMLGAVGPRAQRRVAKRQIDQRRSLTRMTCVAVHSPSPRAVGMPRYADLITSKIQVEALWSS
jgi:hypothetical protein